MLELMLSLGAKKGGVVYPESGPGTKILQFGNTSAGYFGEVSSAELLTYSQAWTLSGLVNGTLYTNEAVWLKFFIDEKVIFVSKRNLAVNMSWDQLYAAGVVFGVRGPGSAPAAAGPVDQFRMTMVKEGDRNWPLKMRLLRGLNAESLDSTANENSEWTRLMCRMSTSGVAPIWAPVPISEFTAGAITSAVMDTWTRSANYTVTRGSGTNWEAVTTLPRAQVTYWRPVLELIDINNLAIDPENVTYMGDGPNVPSIIEVAEDSATWLRDPANVRYGVADLQDFGMTVEDVKLIPEVVLNNWGVVELRDFGVTTETL
jgi:hypothetical protein